MSEVYLATFALGMSGVHLVTWTFISIDIKSVSEVYLESLDTCVCKRYFLMFSSNLEISSVLFL